MATPVGQYTILLPPKQRVFVEARFKEAKKTDPFARKSDVLRDIIKTGIKALEEEES